MNTPTADIPFTDRLLRQHDKWTRLAWPLLIVSVGLAATLGLDWRRHPTLARVEQWGSLGHWWAAGVALTFLAAGGVWFLRRRARLLGARRLDRRLDAKNRLETVAFLRGDAGAMARAQREEVAGFLARQRMAPTHRTPLVALGVLATLLMLAHLIALLSWTRPWTLLASAAKPVPKPSPAALPPAHIRWKTPASEIKALPIEEVPLQALADSTSGLRDAVLEMSVNGQPRLSVPVPAEGLQTAGPHSVQASIYLDQLEVEPFDVVSYYLRAQRIGTRKLPETVSSVQFVQIRPFREDVREAKGEEGNAAFALITALKVAQLRLIKENFVLAHTDLGQDSAEWKKANGNVGGEQAALEKKTGEAVQQLIEDAASAEVINLITQATPFMGEAAKKIAALANGPALTPQSKALGLITEVEKLAHKMAPHGGTMHGQKPKVDDPFGDRQQFEMKQRFKTSGGKLETLAAAQAKVAEDLARPEGAASPDPAPTPDPAEPPDPDKIEGTLGERQTQISQRVGALLTGRIFNPEVTGHLERGHEQARESLRRIDGGDTPSAREPAAESARELQAAVDGMNRVGEEQAKLQLADAQHALNEAADRARDAARQDSAAAAEERAAQAAEQARQIARDLAAQAQAQQETGSSEAAKRLNDMARALDAPDMRNALEKLRAQPHDPAHAQAAADRLQHLAELAAQQRHDGPLSPEELAGLVERLERDRANMQRLAANDPGAKAGPDGNTFAGKHPFTTGEGQPSQNPGQGEQSQGSPKKAQSGSPGKGGTSAQGQGQPASSSRGGGGQPGGRRGQVDSDLGDTLQRNISEQQSGPISPASRSTIKPTYTDHAPAAAQTYDPQETREKFARELVGDVREAAQDAVVVVPKSGALADVRETLRDVPLELHYLDQAALFARIDPPLSGLIDSLHTAQQHVQRDHSLTDANLDLAPPAYRPAVADYFEQLSRDYDGAPAAPEPKNEQ